MAPKQQRTGTRASLRHKAGRVDAARQTHTPATVSAPIEEILPEHSSTVASTSDVAQQRAANGNNPWLLRPGQQTGGHQTPYPQGLSPWQARPVYAQTSPATGVAPVEPATTGRAENGGWAQWLGHNHDPTPTSVTQPACHATAQPIGDGVGAFGPTSDVGLGRLDSAWLSPLTPNDNGARRALPSIQSPLLSVAQNPPMSMPDIFACADRIKAVCDGKEDCGAYLEQLTNITALLGNEGDRLRLTQASLSGEAKLKFIERAFTSFTDAVEWIKTFRDGSTRKHFTAAVAEVIESRQRKGQTAREYIREQEKTFRTEHGDGHDEILIAILIPRLSERISSRFARSFKPGNIEELIAESGRAENEDMSKLRPINCGSTRDPAAAGKTEEASTKEAEKGAMQGGNRQNSSRSISTLHSHAAHAQPLVNTGQDMSVPPPNIRPLTANSGYRALTRHRPYPPFKPVGAAIRCFRCSGEGHLARHCPIPETKN